MNLTLVQNRIKFLLALVTLGVWGEPCYSQDKNEPYIISYVEHDGIINYYVPLLKKAYKKLGITPEFSQINDQRALRLLNDGVIDADTAKSLESIDIYDAITYLPTPISRIEVFLICQKNEVCDLSLLANPEKSMALIGANEFYSELLTDSEIKQVELVSFDTLFKIFDQGKVDAAIIVLDAYTKPKLLKYTNHFLIQEKLGFHLINQKHKALILPLEKAITEVLEEGNFAISK
jgi:hypothetical protein